ncbi:MAG: hypothetical protein K8S16_13915 [Bacteroidales bacterium]|nr:hypothetical protein [Bacteroidales bacterium]
MKKLLFLIFLYSMLKLPVFSQTVVWHEDFIHGQGWFLEDNWAIASGKLEFYWSPSITNFDQQALSPLISLDDNIDELIITQNLDIYTGTPNEFAEISVITETDTVVLWNYELLQGNWGVSTGTEITFSMEEFANQQIRICFRTYGQTTFNWNWWDIFDIKVTAHFDNDLCLHNISGPNSINVLQEGIWTVQVKNLGTNTMSDYTVKIFDYKSGDLIGSYDELDDIQPNEIKTYNFNWMSYAAYNTVFYGALVSTDDLFIGNNTSEAHFVRINPDIEFNLMVWDNDNGIQTVVCPEEGDLITASTGLTRALESAGFEYDYYTYLPDNLEDYDIVFSTMGCFCVD